MNNLLKIRFVIFVLFAALIGGIFSGTVYGQESLNKSMKDERLIWSAGNEDGLYCVFSKERNSQLGYQIYYRRVSDTLFLPGKWYPGVPTEAVLCDNRIQIYLQGGGSQSYSLYESFTEPRLPNELSLIACDSDGDIQYALAFAKESVELELQKDVNETTPIENTDEIDSDVENIQEDTTESWVLSRGDIVLLEHGPDGLWRLSTPDTLPITNWKRNSLSMVVQDQVVTFSGTKTGHFNSVEYHLDTNAFTVYESDLDNVNQIKLLKVNKEILALVERLNEQGHFYIGRIYQGKMEFEDSLNLAESFTSIDFNHVGLGCIGQNIGVTVLDSESEIYFSQYDLQGNVLHPFEKLTNIDQNRIPYLNWLVDTTTTSIVMLIAIGVIFIRRVDMFERKLTDLPAAVVPAPVWKRAQAFLIDFILISIASEFIVRFVNRFLLNNSLPLMTDPEVIFKQLENNFLEPELAKWLLIVLVVYYIILLTYFCLCEMFFGKTLGKRIFNLKVVNYDGEQISKQNAFIRNMFRVIDFFPSPQFYLITLVIVIISNQNQRGGDLLCRSLVIEHRSELKLSEQNTSSPKHVDHTIDDDIS